MDCSKTIDFFAEIKRICALRDDCRDLIKSDICPMYDFCRLAYSATNRIIIKNAILTLQKWSDEHPRKTYAQDFFKKFPNAKPDKEGVPRICRANCYGGSCQHSAISGAGPAPCKDCWNEEMEAEDDE